MSTFIKNKINYKRLIIYVYLIAYSIIGKINFEFLFKFIISHNI